ncbi:hypothetical protein D9M69_692830 [compost metagenome]
MLTSGKIAQFLRRGFGGTGSQLLFSREFQLAFDINGVVFHHAAFAGFALDGVGLRGNAVYTHNRMLGINDGSLVAQNPLRKPPSDN